MSTRYEDEHSPVADAEKTTDKVVERIRKGDEAMSKHFGDKPWESARLSRNEKLAAFSQVAEDDEFWTQAIKKAGQVYPLSDGLAPRELMEEADVMQTLLDEMREKGDTPTGYEWTEDGALMKSEDSPGSPTDDPSDTDAGPTGPSESEY